MSTRVQVAFNAADPHALARFGAQPLHYDGEDHGDVVGHLLRAGHLPDDETTEVDGRPAF